MLHCGHANIVFWFIRYIIMFNWNYFIVTIPFTIYQPDPSWWRPQQESCSPVWCGSCTSCASAAWSATWNHRQYLSYHIVTAEDPVFVGIWVSTKNCHTTSFFFYKPAKVSQLGKNPLDLPYSRPGATLFPFWKTWLLRRKWRPSLNPTSQRLTYLSTYCNLNDLII